MSVLITGGAGYIGSHMVWELVDRGEKVIVLDDLSTGIQKYLPPQVTLIVGDCGDEKLVSGIIREHQIKDINHFAGSINIAESMANPLLYYDNNACKTGKLIKTAIEDGVQRFVFSSTAAVYGLPDHSPIKEDAKLEPISPYGASKMVSEYMLRDAAKAHRFKYVSLRYFNVVGADPKGRTGQSTADAVHLVKRTCQCILGERKQLSIYGNDYPTADGTCVRDYIHVSDLISAHWLAMSYLRDEGESQIFNCGYGHGYSVMQIVEAAKRKSGVDFKTKIAARRPGDPDELVANPDKLKNELGWSPKYDALELIIDHALEWEKKIGA